MRNTDDKRTASLPRLAARTNAQGQRGMYVNVPLAIMVAASRGRLAVGGGTKLAAILALTDALQCLRDAECHKFVCAKQTAGQEHSHEQFKRHRLRFCKLPIKPLALPHNEFLASHFAALQVIEMQCASKQNANNHRGEYSADRGWFHKEHIRELSTQRLERDQ